MGWFGDDLIDVVVDTAEDVGGAIVDTAEAVGGAIIDTAEAIYDGIGGMILDGVKYSAGFGGMVASTVVEAVEDHTGMVWGRISDGVGGMMGGWVEAAETVVETFGEATMEAAQQLSGVTMREPGVSRLVSVDLAEAARLAGAA